MSEQREHWNVQIKIQRVTKEPRTGVMGTQNAEREITEVLSLAVVADSEAEAYQKAERLMKANAPTYRTVME